jgi:hypothetical protein
MFLTHERKMLAARGAGVALLVGMGFGLFMRPDLESGQFQLGSRSEFGFARPAAAATLGGSSDGRGVTILAGAPKPAPPAPKPPVRAAAVKPVEEAAADPVPDIVAPDPLRPAAQADAATDHAAAADDDDAVPAIRGGSLEAAPTGDDEDEGPA